jgi:ABC-type glycerol-3-phosphate transport system permease component
MSQPPTTSPNTSAARASTRSPEGWLGKLGALPSTALVLIVTALVLTPFVWLAIASVKTNEDFFTSSFLPRGNGLLGIAWERLTLDNYKKVFHEPHFARSLLNSVMLSSVTATLATLFAAMAGYALALLSFKGRAVITWLVLGALIIPAPLLIAPGYQILFKLGLLDSPWGLILPAIAPAFGVYLFRQSAISVIPKELLEAARLDGCGELRIFFTIALPLMRPTVSAFVMITFLGTWNNFLTPQIVMQSPDGFPLSVAIAQLKNVYYQDYGLLMAGTVISIAPVAALFLMMQRDFVSGLTRGAVKG